MIDEFVRFANHWETWYSRCFCCLITVGAVYAFYDFVRRKLMMLQHEAYRQGFEDGKRMWEK